VPEKPTVLVLVHSSVIGEAIAAYEDKFDMRYSLDFTKAQSGDHQSVVAQVADMQPALIVVELDSPAPWLATVRSDPATRRIPVIAIETDAGIYKRAALVNIVHVYSPTEFVAGLPDLMTQHVKQFTHAEALERQCSVPMPELVLQGLREFNAREFYECHETLETAWKAESGAVRDLYRAILQVAVAYYQIQRGNYNGAHKLFLRTLQWFAPLPDRCQGIDVAQLRADATAAREHLEALGADRITEFDRSLFKPVQYEGMEN
jgi:uncharacterized protein